MLSLAIKSWLKEKKEMWNRKRKHSITTSNGSTKQQNVKVRSSVRSLFKESPFPTVDILQLFNKIFSKPIFSTNSRQNKMRMSRPRDDG